MEVLKIVVWPITALGFGLLVILIFKHQVIDLLNRTKQIGKDGWQGLDPAGVAKPQNEVELLPEPQALALPHDSSVVLNLEIGIRDHLKTRQFPDAAAREAYLIRLAADVQMAMLFEFFHANIYGSQLAALNLVNIGTQPVVAIKPFYERGKELFPQLYERYEFDGWLRWLETPTHFISREGEFVSITPEGREFLKYLVSRGYALFKQS